MKDQNVDHLMDLERAEHNDIYSQLGNRVQRPLTIEDFERSPSFPFQRGFGLYTAEKHQFLRAAEPYIRKAVSEGFPVLDYGCGVGDLACYLALRGCKEVYGFDLSEVGIEVGRRLARLSGVEDHVFLQPMLAQKLDYPDGKFPLVLGKGVLHHVLKYPGIADELHRVMSDGGVALFVENLGNGLLWRWIRSRSIGMYAELGDINLTTSFIKNTFKDFRTVKVRGIYVLFMGKRFFFTQETFSHLRFGGLGGLLSRAIMASGYVFDEVVFNHTPLGNWLGGICVITLEK